MIEVPFTWSFSSLTEFEICPLKMASKRFYKTVEPETTEATIWGTRVHAMAEAFMKGEEITDPEAFKVVEKWVTTLKKHPGKPYVEEMFCLDENWKLVEDREGAACTAFIDLAFINNNILNCIDFKTGRVKDDFTQLKFYCLLFALKYPEIHTFNGIFIWLKENRTTDFRIERKELLPVFKDLKARVARMKEAYDEDNFVARRNGLCRNYCETTDCSYCGGGR